ncbi:MAG: PAS domain S-box protein [Alphaproteobacteria bacterium]|nr:PAS domain S-box protein [Alphaproteobacteria bacterium]
MSSAVFNIFADLGILSLAATLLLLFSSQGWSHRFLTQQTVLGIIFGFSAALTLAFPIEGSFGMTFDSRAAPIVLASYLGGLPGGLIAASITGMACYMMDSVTVTSDIAGIFLYFLSGLICRWIMRKSRLDLMTLILLGGFATIAVSPSLFITPRFADSILAFAEFWIILLVGNIAATIILGMLYGQLMKNVENSIRSAFDLNVSKTARNIARIGLWNHDLRKKTAVWDPVMYSILGYEPHEIDANLERFRERIHPDDLLRCDAVWSDAAKNGSSFDLNFRIITQAGAMRKIRSVGGFLGELPGKPDTIAGVSIDLTEQEGLREETLLQSVLLACVSCGVLITDVNDGHKIVFANDAVTRITGYPRAEIIGQHCRFLNEGLEEQANLQIVRKAISNGQQCEVVLKNKKRDGSIFWNNLKISPIVNDIGQATHFIGILEDVTVSITAKEEIEAARDELSALLSASSDGIISIDENGMITSFNPAAEKMFGYTKQQVLGSPIEILVPDDLRAGHRHNRDTYIADNAAKPGPMTGFRSISAQRQDGTTFPVLVSLAPYNYKGKRVVAATIHDKTELAMAAERLEVATMAAKLGVWDYNVTSNTLVWDRHMFEIFGISQDEFKGTFADWEDLLHPEDRADAVSTVEKSINAAEPFSTSFRIIRPDGKTRYISAEASIITSKFGEAEHLIGINSDITERRELEIALIQSQRVDAIGKLTGGIAHDFNNILHIISGNAQLLDLHLEALFSEKPDVQRKISTIIDAVDRGAALTRRLLAYSRQEPLSPETFEVGEMLTSVGGFLARTLGGRIDLKIITRPGKIYIHADQKQLENAIINLAINSRDALPHGGIVEIESSFRTIDANHESMGEIVEPGSYIVISVTDSGEGIPKDNIERVIEPFYTTKDVGKGSGLGLSMVYGFVRQSGGFMTINSELNQGTRIDLYLPTVANEALDIPPLEEMTLEPELSPVPVPLPAKASARILLVDDNPEVRQIPFDILTAQGFNVIVADNGVEALTLMKETPTQFDILFTDIVLPAGINGIELARRAFDLAPDIKVLYTSGYSESFVDQWQDIPFGETLLRKPYRRADLLTRITELLEADAA